MSAKSGLLCNIFLTTTSKKKKKKKKKKKMRIKGAVSGLVISLKI